MKTIINKLKKHLLVSSLLISAVTMSAADLRYPSAPQFNNINLTSMYVEFLSGNINETALEMEKWMYDISYWNYSWIAEADDPEVLIEDWMADASYWNYSWIAEVNDPEVLIEEWMVDASYWNYSWIAEVNDPEVLIEEWMSDPDHWRLTTRHDCARLNEAAVPEKSMRINDWMKDTGRWITGS